MVVGEGNGNPLQYSCLENPVDRGAWRAAFPWGHTESDTTKVTWHARMHACMYGCKSWTIKKVEHQRTDAFELWCWRRVLGIFWTARRLNQLIVKKINTEVKPVNRKGNQHWIFIGRTDAEVEAPILWPPNAKNWLIGKDPDAEKDWRQEEKWTTEDEMVRWHH